jgi:TIR domain
MERGGPLGEPSFETIGNFFAAGFIYVGIYILFFKSGEVKSFFHTNYLSTLTFAIMSYGAVFLFWHSISNGKSQPEGWNIKAYVFDGSFPHPERIFLLPLMISILFIVYYLGIKKINRKEFDVAISYSYEDADFTNKLHDKLNENGIRIYQDSKYLKEIVGGEISPYLDTVFRHRSTYGLIIVSKNYLNSKYGSVELTILKDKCRVNKDVILPIIIDGTKLSKLGLSEDLAYLDAQKFSIDTIAEIITLKVRTKPAGNKI